MAQTPFSKRVEIISAFYSKYANSEEWQEYFEALDLGVPLAVAIDMGGATATEEGIKWIDEAWDELCETLEIDRHGEYNSFDEVMKYAESE